MKEKELKNKTKNKLKQAGMAGAIAAAVVPTVAAIALTSEDDFKKSNNSISFATAKASGNTATNQAVAPVSYSTSSIPVPKNDPTGTNTDWQKLLISNPDTHKYDWVSAQYNGDTFLPELNDFSLSYVTVTNQKEGIVDNLKKIELGHAQGDSKRFTLNLSSGLQAPNITDSFMDKLATRYNAVKKANVDKQQLRNAFKAYYVIEGDSEWRLLADANGYQNSGTNSFAIGDLSKFMVNGKLPNVHVAWFFNFDPSVTKSSEVSSIPEALKQQLQGLGGTYTIDGGSRPSSMFKTLTDYSDFYSDSSIPLPSFADGTNPANAINTKLKNQLDNIVSGIKYTGTTSETVVNLSQTFDFEHDADVVKFFSNSQNDYTPFKLAHNAQGAKQIYPSFYYSVGEEVDLHKVQNGAKSFTISNWNSNLIRSKNGKGPYLNDIHFYIALDSQDTNNEKIIKGYDGAASNNHWGYFNTVGIRSDVTSYDPTTGATKPQFAGIKDVVSTFEVPKPVDDTKPTRNVTEAKSYGLIDNADANGQFQQKENIKFKYRIAGTTTWYSKDDFFGAGKPGSTPEALSVGTEWQVTTTATWDNALTIAPPNGATWIATDKAFTGTVGWDLPIITQIDDPIFKVTNSTNYSITLPTNNVGISYKFRLVNPENTTDTLAWPNKTKGEYITYPELAKIASADLPNIFNQANGKFWAIQWEANALNPKSTAKQATGIYHATSNDLPSVNTHAIVRDGDNGTNLATPIIKEAQPQIDSTKTTDTSHINIKLPTNNVFRYKFSFDQSRFDLHLDANNFLVDANGKLVNAFNNTTHRAIYWTLDTPPVSANSNVDFLSKTTNYIGSIATDSIAKYIDTVSFKPLLNATSTVDFTIQESGPNGVHFPVDFQYSVDNVHFVDSVEFAKRTTNADNILHTDVDGFASNTRNLFDGTKILPIYYRTKPFGPTNQYKIDDQLAQSMNLKYDAKTQAWYGTIDTTTTKIAVSTDGFWNNNVPSIPSSSKSTTDFTVDLPVIPNVVFKFKFATEGDGAYNEWAAFKSRVNGNWTTVTGTKAVTKEIQWAAFVVDSSKYVFADTTLKAKQQHLIDANGQFIPQTLDISKLAVEVPVAVQSATFDGTNTDNLRLKGFDQPGVTYEYSLDNWVTSETFENFNQDQGLRNQVINSDGRTLKDIKWRVRFDSPFVAKTGSTTSGTLTLTNVKILISAITPLTANIFKGTNSIDWEIDLSKITQIGVKYKLTINGKDYELNDPALSDKGKLNLFNSATNNYYDISWKAEPENGFTWSGQPVTDLGVIRISLDRYIDKLTLPNITGPMSNQFEINDNYDLQLSEVDFTYQSPTVAWADKNTFKTLQKNIWNATGQKFYDVKFKVTPKHGYVLADNIQGITNNEGNVSIDQTITRVIGNAPMPSVGGSNTVNYTLEDNVSANHVVYRYWSTDAEKGANGLTFAQFKANHPNIYDQSANSKITIHYSANPEPGFNFPVVNEAVITADLSNMTNIIEVAKLPTLSVSANSGNTSSFTPTSSVAIPDGVEYLYSTSVNGTFRTMSAFMAAEKNLYNAVDGTLKQVFYKPSTNSKDYKLDNQNVSATELNIDALPKLIDVFTPPKIAPTKSNQWSVTYTPVPNLTMSYWSSASGSTTRFANPASLNLPTNIFRGKDAEPVINWEITPASGFVLAGTVNPIGNLSQDVDKLIRVYDAESMIPAPSLNNPSPTNWKSIQEVTPPGLQYKYYLEGEDKSKALPLQQFQSTHDKIYAGGKYLDIHFIAEVAPKTPADNHTYEIDPKVQIDRVITVTNRRTVINNVVTPTFNIKDTVNSANFKIVEHNPSEVTTKYSIVGTGANNLSLAELTNWIQQNHESNLWDKTTDQFYTINWKVTPTDVQTDLDPTTTTSGTIDYAPAFAAHKMDKFILPTAPVLGGSSTKTSDITFSNLDTTHFEYRYSRNGTGTGNEGKWVIPYAGLYGNFYDSKSGTLRGFYWKAAPKDGYATDAQQATGQITTPDSIVKYIDVINAPTLTGTATDAYAITELPDKGIKITYSTNSADLNSFKSLTDFNNDPANKNIAGKTVYYLVTATDAAYKIDQTKFGQPIAFTTTLNKALDTFAVPTFAANSKSNVWTIETPDTNVEYQFQITSKNTGWVSAQELFTKVGANLFDSQNDLMLEVEYKVKAKTGNVFSSTFMSSWAKKSGQGVDTELLGNVATANVTKVVTSVAAPTLSWAGNDKKSNNYTVKSGGTKSVSYSISVGDTNHYVPLATFNPSNLYDSTTGQKLKIYWKADVTTGHEKVQPWTFDDKEISENDIQTWVIDSVTDSALEGINSAAAPESTAFNFTTPSANVEYYFVDTNDATPLLEKIDDFKQNHMNLFNSDHFSLDDVKFVVKAVNGFELGSNITNKYDAGISSAKAIDLSQIIKVMENDITPILNGPTTGWSVTTNSVYTSGITYEFQVDGTSDAFQDIVPTIALHTNLDFNNAKHNVNWQAVLQPLYKLKTGIAEHGTLDSSNLTSDLEITHITVPTISFTNTHDYNIANTALTPNVEYKFGLAGELESTFVDWTSFKTAHANLFNVSTGVLKNIAWTASPSTQASYHFNTTDAKSGTIDIQHEKRYIDLLPAPTLVNPSALSTALDFNEPAPYNGYVSYKYSIDGQGSYTKDQLITEYAKLNWNNNAGVIKFDATVPAYDANGINYVIGSKAAQTIDTSKIVKVVDPSALKLDAASNTTSEYSFTSDTTIGLTYFVSIDGKKTWTEFLAFDALKTPLFTFDGGLVAVDWKVESEPGYAIKTGATADGTIDISSLKKIIDKVPSPQLTGTDTTDYSLNIDSNTVSLFNYKYSFDPQADHSTFVSLADLKKSTQGKNIYDLTQEANKTIYFLPDAIGNVDFATTPSVGSIDTKSLVSVIDSITAPTLTTTSVNSDDYDIIAGQNGVDFTFSTDQNGAYVSLPDFLQAHTNIYDNDTWTLPNIFWKASVSTTHIHQNQVFKFSSNVTPSGTIDTQKLKKVIDKMPKISAAGSTVDFKETNYDDPNQALLSIPGLRLAFAMNNKHYSSFADLLSAEKANDANFNLWNVRNNQMESITYDVTKIEPDYILKNSTDRSGNVATDKLVKVIDYINEGEWVPITKTGSNYDNYDFLIANIPSHLSSLFNYKYATSENAPESDWLSLAAFHTKYPKLMNNADDPTAVDHSIMRVFYKIELSDTTNYKFVQPNLKGVKEEIKLGIKNVIFNIPAPKVSTSNLHNGANGAVGQNHPSSRTFELEYPDPNIDYLFKLGNDPNWMTFDQLLRTSGFNTYDSVNNGFKDLIFQASPKPGYQFSTGRSTQQGMVDMDNSGVTKVIEKVVAPVLEGTDTLHYSFGLPQGKTEFTKGLDYLLKVEGKTEELTPADWVKSGLNLFDVAHNKNLRVSYVLKPQAGYSVIDPNVQGNLTLPQNMVNVIDNVTPPIFRATTNILTTEDWDLLEQGANGFAFKYSIDGGKNYVTKAGLTTLLKPMFNNIYDNNTEISKSITWKAEVNDSSRYSISVASGGQVDIPTTIIKAIDDVEYPTIPPRSESNNYSFKEGTKNIQYLYKLAAELDDNAHWKNQADFIAAHPNLYDMDYQQIRVAMFKVVANSGFVLSSNAKIQGGNIDIGNIETYVLSRIPSVQVAPNGTTRVYQFVPDETKTGIEYEYGLNENGPFESQSDFISNHGNLFDADNGLAKVYWHAKTTSTTFRFDYGLTQVGEIDLSSLTKVVDKDANVPTFTSSSSTLDWYFDPLDTQGPWIDHYELKMDGDAIGWRTIEQFKNAYPNLTNYRDQNANVYWRAIAKAPEYVWGTNARREGLLDLSPLQQKYTTSSFDLTKLSFAVTDDNRYTPQYNGVDGLPEPAQTDGFHLEYAWGDQPNQWIENRTRNWVFHQTLAPSELWDNDHVNADGTAGIWQHNGKISFKFVPNSATSGIDNNQLITINFDDLVAQKEIVKIITNPRISVNSEPHIQGDDIHLGYLAKYTSQWDPKTDLVDSLIGSKPGSDSLLPILGIWYEKPINNYQIVVNPFEGMTKSEIERLINSMKPERLAYLQANYPQYVPNTISLDQIKDTFRKMWLNQNEAIQFFLMMEDIWTGSEWLINSISAKSLADPDFKVVQEATRVVWSRQDKTIAKVTDNSEIISELQDRIKPADQVDSLHDHVVWGDKSKLMETVANARAHNLNINLAIELDTNGNPVWHKLADLSDPNDFFNAITEINQDHKKRVLLLQVLSSDIDEATGTNVKVTDESIIDLTQQSGIKRVKTRITATGKYNTTNIHVSGFTDVKTDVDDSVVTEPYLQVTYKIKQAPGVWFTKDGLIAKIDELRDNDTFVYGEDITAHIGLADSLNDKYSLGEIIEGPVDFSHLYTNVDEKLLTEYIKDLKNDIKLIGTPLDAAHQASTDKTMYVTLDNSDLTASEFNSHFGIQYRVNDSNVWNLFDPEVKKSLNEDPKNNIIGNHAAGTYMPINAHIGDKFYFRIVPIATADGTIVITPQDANYTQQEIFNKTRMKSSDWDGTPTHQGTIIERDTNSLLLSGEHKLLDFINKNADDVAKLPQGQQADSSWIHPFLALVTSRPRFEIIQDAVFDPMIKTEYEILSVLNDGDEIDSLVREGILTDTERTVIEDTIKASTPRRDAQNQPVAWEQAYVDKKGNPMLISDPNKGKVGDPDLNVDNSKGEYTLKHVNIAPRPAIVFVSDFRIKHPEILRKLYAYDDTQRSAHDFNKDLIQSGESSFEITQIGSGSVDQYGQRFTHSNTIFFGTNAIRFNVWEDYIDQTNHIADAYFIGEDSVQKEGEDSIKGERIAKIHVSTQYSLESMELVLELVNGQTVFIEKSFEGSSQDEAIRYARLDPKLDALGKQLDINKNGGNWVYASESLIEKNVEHVDVEGSNLPSNEEVAMDKANLKKTIRHWVAPKEELADHTAKNELPYSLSHFDNGDVDQNAIVLALTDQQNKEISSGATSNPGAIYRNEIGNVIEWFGSSSSAKTSNSTKSASATATSYNNTSYVTFDTNAHFATVDKYANLKVFEETIQDSATNEWKGYMLVKSDADSQGNVKLRAIEQSSKSMIVNDLTYNPSLGVPKANKNFPTWAIILASAGTAGILGSTYGGYLWYNKRIAKKAARLRRPTMPIKFRKK